MRLRDLASLALMTLASMACGGEGPPEPGVTADGDTLAGLAQPPSAGAPRTSTEGFAPDTVRPGTAGEDSLGPAPAVSELDVDSIVARYSSNYGSELVQTGSDVQGDVDPAIVEAAKRRTALDFGYVEISAWMDLMADLTEAQRAEVTRRIDEANRRLARELHAGGPITPG
ncbi:MAG TPA: hypothetical protein VJP59_06560 [Gemmatimonadota bacterium]|nr:hypothetical protein [Gemmatimonadota bacterium]